jgi:hypothetical protein
VKITPIQSIVKVYTLNGQEDFSWLLRVYVHLNSQEVHSQLLRVYTLNGRQKSSWLSRHQEKTMIT